jgi:uncharacterized PurR-regulated membrane protein YhhQ (DUF165 family)
MTLQQRRDLAFLVLAGIFLGTMGMLNILGLTRFLQLGTIGSWPVVVAVGALPNPITFLCTDLISELWGEQKAGQLVWVGLLLNGWIVLILWLGGILPGLAGAPEATFFEVAESKEFSGGSAAHCAESLLHTDSSSDKEGTFWGSDQRMSSIPHWTATM